MSHPGTTAAITVAENGRRRLWSYGRGGAPLAAMATRRCEQGIDDGMAAAMTEAAEKELAVKVGCLKSSTHTENARHEGRNGNGQ